MEKNYNNSKHKRSILDDYFEPEGVVFIKLSVKILLILVSLILTLRTCTITDEGEAKVVTTFGKIEKKPLDEGLTLINPLSNVSVYSTRADRYEIEDLDLPTQDRFNSYANITILYRIERSMTPAIKKNYGNSRDFINKILRQHVRSIIRDEARKIKDSRQLGNSTVVSNMQNNTKERLKKVVEGSGMVVLDLMIQKLTFDERIEGFIRDTQQRMEEEQKLKSEERQAITAAEIQKQKAIGEANKKREHANAIAYEKKKLAEAEAEAKLIIAKGEAAALIAKATAEAEGIRLKAKANAELSKSLTPAILEKMALDNESILFNKSKGNVPHTVIGDTDIRALGAPVLQTVGGK